MNMEKWGRFRLENVVCRMDEVVFGLKAPFDFDFLRKYGRVFKVFDDQDSGNICFGMERGGVRRFVKFAGAPTLRGGIAPEEAVRNLRSTEPVYKALQHGNLIHLLEAEEIGSGFAMVFEWTDAECMGRMYPESRAKFMAMSMEKKLQVFADVQRFLDHVARSGYVAIDFYDGSIMYDFGREKTMICDIDFFRPQPCVNDMGRMWGSARFMSPEEFELGAALDEVTNVYTLGATAFALFADGVRSRESWPFGDAAYGVVARAVCPERSGRQQSIREFMEAWRAAL